VLSGGVTLIGGLVGGLALGGMLASDEEVAAVAGKLKELGAAALAGRSGPQARCAFHLGGAAWGQGRVAYCDRGSAGPCGCRGRRGSGGRAPSGRGRATEVAATVTKPAFAGCSGP